MARPRWCCHDNVDPLGTRLAFGEDRRRGCRRRFACLGGGFARAAGTAGGAHPAARATRHRAAPDPAATSAAVDRPAGGLAGAARRPLARDRLRAAVRSAGLRVRAAVAGTRADGQSGCDPPRPLSSSLSICDRIGCPISGWTLHSASGVWRLDEFALVDRLGVDTGFSPAIVLLTATHFHFAGFGLLGLASLLAGSRPWLRASLVGLMVGIR